MTIKLREYILHISNFSVITVVYPVYPQVVSSIVNIKPEPEL
jgi:hypothetical protein